MTIVIGKLAKDVSEEEALNYVLGYTVGNDASRVLSCKSYSCSHVLPDNLPHCSVANVAVGVRKGIWYVMCSLNTELTHRPPKTTRPPLDHA